MAGGIHNIYIWFQRISKMLQWLYFKMCVKTFAVTTVHITRELCFWGILDPSSNWMNSTTL